MTLTVPSSAIDLVSQPVVQDPYTTFEELRGLGSFVWLERHRAWLLLENELVRAALNDDALSTDTITPLQRRLSEEQRKRFQPAADIGSAATLSRNCSQAGRGKTMRQPSGCLVSVSWPPHSACRTSRCRAGTVKRPLASNAKALAP